MLQAVSDDWYVDGYSRRRVNTVQAAEMAGVSRRTIYNWMRAGRVEYVRTPTGAVRIYADTLLTRPEAD
jgi:excisionase family DNA binding protein